MEVQPLEDLTCRALFGGAAAPPGQSLTVLELSQAQTHQGEAHMVKFLLGLIKLRVWHTELHFSGIQSGYDLDLAAPSNCEQKNVLICTRIQQDLLTKSRALE